MDEMPRNCNWEGHLPFDSASSRSAKDSCSRVARAISLKYYVFFSWHFDISSRVKKRDKLLLL